MDALPAIIGAVLLVLAVANMVKNKAKYAPYVSRSAWWPITWPQGRAAWEAEIRLWGKIALWSTVAGGVFAFLVWGV